MDIGITEATWREVDKPSINIYMYICVCVNHQVDKDAKRQKQFPRFSHCTT
jgi:hypothetical protein